MSKNVKLGNDVIQNVTSVKLESADTVGTYVTFGEIPTVYSAMVGIMTSTYNSTINAEAIYDTSGISNEYCVDEDGNYFNGSNGIFQYRIYTSGTWGNWIDLSAGTTVINPGSGSHMVEFRFANTSNNKSFGLMEFAGIPDYIVGLYVKQNSTGYAFSPIISTRNYPTYYNSYVSFQEGYFLSSDVFEQTKLNSIYSITWKIAGEED